MARYSLFLLLFLLFSPYLSVVVAETQPLPVEIEVHILINEERADEVKHGVELQPLKLHSGLIEIARDHSKDMAERGYFAHENPEGDDVFDRLATNGIEYQSAGENLFTSSSVGDSADMAADAVAGWINSPGHYANILTPYLYTGIGYYELDGQYFLTQVFLTADRSELEAEGVIYDNDNLDQFATEDESFFSRYINQNTIIGIIVIFAILVGIDAQRRNRSYYAQGKRRRRR